MDATPPSARGARPNHLSRFFNVVSGWYGTASRYAVGQSTPDADFESYIMELGVADLNNPESPTSPVLHTSTIAALSLSKCLRDLLTDPKPLPRASPARTSPASHTSRSLARISPARRQSILDLLHFSSCGVPFIILSSETTITGHLLSRTLRTVPGTYSRLPKKFKTDRLQLSIGERTLPVHSAACSLSLIWGRCTRATCLP